jgi:hypothetical protein
VREDVRLTYVLGDRFVVDPGDCPGLRSAGLRVDTRIGMSGDSALSAAPFGEWRAPPRVVRFWLVLLVSYEFAMALTAASFVLRYGLSGTAVAAFPVAFALGPAWMLKRLRRVGVAITATEIVVVGPMRTWRVPIDDAAEFAAEVRTGGNGQPTISLRRRSGGSVGLSIFNRNGFVSQMSRLAHSLELQAAQLNAALDNARRA